MVSAKMARTQPDNRTMELNSEAKAASVATPQSEAQDSGPDGVHCRQFGN
jgi:hypothetical protein